ncbi:unnamed protein product [Moneuplotes crassus]|uniref:Uncharacterized protein n=1 Tax=Euplotes crassus TaxID=5936 RepID=A0AAD1XZH2_EUPCR|nr:unnamed protein product [Moneuplotes crassus]
MRHGERSDFAGHTVIRKEDPALSPNGHIQAYQTGEFLKKFFRTNQISNYIIYSSPLVRAIQTASEVSKALGAPSVTLHNGICDQFDIYGSPLGLKGIELFSRDESTFYDLYLPESNVKLKNKEPDDEPRDSIRISEEFIDKMKDSEVQAIVAVSHWDAVKNFSDHYQADDEYRPMPNCAVSCLEVDLDEDFKELIMDRQVLYK